MPFDFGEGLSTVNKYIFEGSILGPSFGNGFIVGAIIAFAMLLIVMIMYPAKSGTSVVVLFKMLFYMTIASVSILFLHDGVVSKKYQKKIEQLQDDDFTHRMNSKLITNNSIKIVPDEKITGGRGKIDIGLINQTQEQTQNDNQTQEQSQEQTQNDNQTQEQELDNNIDNAIISIKAEQSTLGGYQPPKQINRFS